MSSMFYNSMSSVLSQWSDFRVSRHLYKAYFNAQKSEKSSGSKESTRRQITYKNTFDTSRMGKLTDGVTSSVKSLESAFAVQKDTGTIDRDKAYSAAEDFVKSYNDLVSSIKSSGNKQISGKQQFIANMTNAYSRRLEKVGVSIGADGKLSIDREKFQSAGDGDYEAIFGRKNSFAEFMSGQASQLAKIDTAVKKTSAASAYTKSGARNSYLTSGELMNFLK